ncbi:MAG: hypothetical protein GPW19_04080 [Euryarchaeota archaeon]|nr:hypothetical protein [Euryarchaeota archaeon]
MLENQNRNLVNGVGKENSINGMHNTVLKNLNFIDENGKINLVQPERFRFFDLVNIRVRDGDLTFQSMNASNTVLVIENFSTILHDGYYLIDYDNINKSLTLENWPINKCKPKDFWKNSILPSIDYSSEAVHIYLGGKNLKDFIKIVKEVKKKGYEYIYFEQTDNKVDVYYFTGHKSDQDGNEGKVVRQFSAVEIKSSDKKIIKMHTQADLIYEVLEQMFGEHELRYPKGEHVLLIDVKTDKPLKLMTRRIGEDHSRIEVIGFVAPIVDYSIPENRV